MAEIAGKTGQELEKGLIQEQAERVEATTLPAGTTIEPEKLEVKPGEEVDTAVGLSLIHI